MTVTIYHNPRCSKSRATLQLLEERGIQPEIVKYLETPLDASTLKRILKMLKLTPQQIMRTRENEYRELGLADKPLSDEELINIIVAHPRLMERPIVVKGKRAAMGRPPESVLEIL